MSASVPPTPHRPPALLSEKYRPTRLEDLIGNGRARSELRAWANSWTHGPPPRFRAALLDGPAGVGKTSATHAVAADMGWEVVELNASDARNRTAIERVAGRTALTQAFGLDGSFTSVRDGGRTLILLDEADCLTGRAAEEVATKRPTTSFREFLRSRYVDISSLNKAWELTTESTPKAFEAWSDAPATRGRGAWGRLRAAQRDLQDWEGTRTPTDRSDRGGLGAIDELVRTTLQPLVLTVNDPSPLTRYSKTFRQNVARIPFHAVDPDEIRRLLRKVVLAEGIQITPAALEAIVVRSQGDVRAALTDLDAIAPLPAGREQLLVLSPRDQGINLEPFLAEVLQRPRWYRSVEIRDRVDTPPEDLIPWIEENLPRAAEDPQHLWEGFVRLAGASELLSRARRTRNFGLWSYASELATGGVSIAIDRTSGSRVNIRFPEFLMAMGRSKISRGLRTEIAGRVGSSAHMSRRKSVDTVLPMLERIFDPARAGFQAPAVARLRSRCILTWGLTPEQVGYLMGREPGSPEVVTEVERSLTLEPNRSASAPAAAAIEEANPPPKASGHAQRHLGDF